MTGLVLGHDGRNTTRGRGPLRGRRFGLATVAEQLNIVAFAAHSALGGSKFVGQGLSSMIIVLEPAVRLADDGTHASGPAAVCDEIPTCSEERAACAFKEATSMPEAGNVIARTNAPRYTIPISRTPHLGDIC
jgi:hypothetical protein